ncbi:hypothetical protein BDP27DRAFT_1428212 [Rhodocollybia butyracea]|uniref:Uncharacterized protein n=1 Tax=Rhodocollybia butyracea TaxID=206335 RepID=A0A9P5PHG7_9AGAR|nr:hypothetical protein BDP27DRAFT_1428212 [Rhodocollybia butyracea]
MRLTVPYASVLLVASFSCTWATPIVNRDALIKERSGSALSSRATDSFGPFEGFHALRARGGPKEKETSFKVTGSGITKSTKPPSRAQHLTEEHVEARLKETQEDAHISDIDDERTPQKITTFYFDYDEDNKEGMKGRAKKLIERKFTKIKLMSFPIAKPRKYSHATKAKEIRSSEDSWFCLTMSKKKYRGKLSKDGETYDELYKEDGTKIYPMTYTELLNV